MLIIALKVIAAAAVLAAAPQTPAPQPGTQVDLAVFGQTLTGPDSVGVEWDNPREVEEVRLAGFTAEKAAAARLEWWGSVWPANGGGGWMALDDPWNGQWAKVATKPSEISPGVWTWKMPPLTRKE